MKYVVYYIAIGFILLGVANLDTKERCGEYPTQDLKEMTTFVISWPKLIPPWFEDKGFQVFTCNSVAAVKKEKKDKTVIFEEVR